MVTGGARTTLVFFFLIMDERGGSEKESGKSGRRRCATGIPGVRTIDTGSPGDATHAIRLSPCNCNMRVYSTYTKTYTHSLSLGSLFLSLTHIPTHTHLHPPTHASPANAANDRASRRGSIPIDRLLESSAGRGRGISTGASATSAAIVVVVSGGCTGSVPLWCRWPRGRWGRLRGIFASYRIPSRRWDGEEGGGLVHSFIRSLVRRYANVSRRLCCQIKRNSRSNDWSIKRKATWNRCALGSTHGGIPYHRVGCIFFVLIG